LGKISGVLLTGLIAFSSARIIAQVPDIKPGPEHAVLKDFTGDWEATVNSQGSESKGATAAKMGVGGLWLIEDFKGDFAGTTFEGHGVTSYDPAKKKYIMVWVDSMSASPMILEGTYDKAAKTMTMAGTMAMPDGTSMKVKQTTVTKDADTRVMTMKAGEGGNEMVMLEVTYKRKPKK
jgi:hypothetical protein